MKRQIIIGIVLLICIHLAFAQPIDPDEILEDVEASLDDLEVVLDELDEIMGDVEPDDEDTEDSAEAAATADGTDEEGGAFSGQNIGIAVAIIALLGGGGFALWKRKKKTPSARHDAAAGSDKKAGEFLIFLKQWKLENQRAQSDNKVKSKKAKAMIKDLKNAGKEQKRIDAKVEESTEKKEAEVMRWIEKHNEQIKNDHIILYLTKKAVSEEEKRKLIFKHVLELYDYEWKTLIELEALLSQIKEDRKEADKILTQMIERAGHLKSDTKQIVETTDELIKEEKDTVEAVAAVVAMETQYDNMHKIAKRNKYKTEDAKQLVKFAAEHNDVEDLKIMKDRHVVSRGRRYRITDAGADQDGLFVEIEGHKARASEFDTLVSKIDAKGLYISAKRILKDANKKIKGKLSPKEITKKGIDARIKRVEKDMKVINEIPVVTQQEKAELEKGLRQVKELLKQKIKPFEKQLKSKKEWEWLYKAELIKTF